MNLKVSSTAYIVGKVVRLHAGQHIPIEHQFVALQLPDGQTVETNVRNLADYNPSEPSAVVDVAKELAQAKQVCADTAAALNASREEVLTLQAELGAIRELLAASEARTAALESAAAAATKTTKLRGR